MLTDKQKGLTRAEIIIGVFAFVLLLGLSLPSFLEIVRNTQLKDLGDKMIVDFELAQTESVMRNESLFISASASDASWCYGLSVGKACDCTQVNSCQLDSINTTVQSDDYSDLSVVTSSTVLRLPLEFKPSGVVDASGYFEVVNSMGKKLGVKLNTKGVVDKCSDSAAWGYSSC